MLYIYIYTHHEKSLLYNHYRIGKSACIQTSHISPETQLSLCEAWRLRKSTLSPFYAPAIMQLRHRAYFIRINTDGNN